MANLVPPQTCQHVGQVYRLVLRDKPTVNALPDSAFDIKIAYSLAEVSQAEWDALSGERPFQSCRWYTYGERVMADCPPFYIILSLDKKPVARATFWLVRKEPLPLPPLLRTFAQAVFRRWPLLICRSPLAGLSGLILPDPPLRDESLKVITRVALAELRRLGGSFLIFDYLEPDQTAWPGWPREFTTTSISDPGTWMPVKWDSFEAYLTAGNKKTRQNYKRSLQQAGELGIQVTKRQSVPDMDTALALVRNLEKKHNSASNPWARGMLENIKAADGAFLEARIGERLVGCVLIFEDNRVQMIAAMGLAGDVPGVYFQLIYASLQAAFERKVRLLRWGSGAYDVKRRLGFELDQNNYVVFYGRNPIYTLLGQLLAYAAGSS
ncbi:MAG: GNAT family N-acetyltransferase [Anaerolineales bacterium]|nr:GNAT family N-acetyltransferase [Anaerolineales bacterium]